MWRKSAVPSLARAFNCRAAHSLSRTAAAYGGELSTRITLDNKVAAMHHPLATYGASHGTFIYVPRFGALLGYGVANWLELGVGGSVSLSRDLEAQNVRYQDALGNLCILLEYLGAGSASLTF